jgi:beta-lactamase regulating signal transducer with metallopeptidase domain
MTLSLNIIQFILSTFILFLILSYSIEICFRVFNVKNPRARVIFRLLPLIKLTLTLFFFGKLEKLTYIDINIFNCKNPIKPLILNFFSISNSSLMMILYAILTAFFLISLIKITITTLQLYRFFSFIIDIQQNAAPCLRKIYNQALLKKIGTMKIRLLTSQRLNSPIACGLNTIVIPQDLLNDFSQQEFEAVIAHEIEHLIHKDPLLKSLLIVIQSLFWWIPLNRWIEKLEIDQELACDSTIYKYGCDNSDLANAIVSTLKWKHNFNYDMIASNLASHKQSVKVRIQELLTPSWNNNSFSTMGIFAIVLLVILVGFQIC